MISYIQFKAWLFIAAFLVSVGCSNEKPRFANQVKEQGEEVFHDKRDKEEPNFGDATAVRANEAVTEEPDGSLQLTAPKFILVKEGQKVDFQLTAKIGRLALTQNVAFECSESCIEQMKVDSASGSVEWQTDFQSAGAYDVSFGAKADDQQVFQTVRILVQNENQGVDVSDLGSFSVKEGDAFTAQILATDPDGDPLQFGCMEQCIDGLTFNEDGTISWTTDYEDAGSYSPVLMASDGNQAVPVNLTLNVENVNRLPTVAPITKQTLVEGQPFTYQIQAQDPDQSPLSYSCENTCPAGLSIDANGLISWTPTYDQAGDYPVNFNITDGEANIPLAAEFAVQNFNRMPTIASETIQINEGELLTYQIKASDPDANPLTYSCLENCLPGMNVDAASGVLTYTPSQQAAGIYDVTLAVSDGEAQAKGTLKIEVMRVNLAPVLQPIADQNVDELQALTFDLIASDPDMDALKYSCISACPSNLVVDQNTGKVTFNPSYSQQGEYQVGFQVSDGFLTATHSAKITVNQVNAPPALAPIAAKTIAEMATLTFTLGGSDIDGDALSYSCITNCPPGLAVDAGNGSVTWQPNFSQSGNYQVTFRVSDGALSADATAQITVLQVNAPPTLNPITDQTIPENSPLNFNLSASDSDGDTLTYSCVLGCPVGLNVDGPTGAVSFTPNYTQAGEYFVTFSVSDGTANAQAVGKITVTQVNAPPTLSVIPNQNAAENSQFTYTLMGQDIDGDTLTYNCIQACPTGLTVDPTTGVINWKPDYTQEGIYDITFEVSDGALTDTKVGKITVLGENAPPTLTAIPDQTTPENSLLSFTLNGQDIDGSSLMYSCITACPAGMTVDATSGQVNWTPDYNASGEYFVTFSVTDGIAAANQVGKITVTQVNAPPTINTIPDQAVAEMTTLNFTVTGQDIDGDTLTFSCTQNCPTGLTVDGPTGNVTWQPNFTQAGEYLPVFTVSDGNLTADTTAKITVTGSNAPPTLTAIPDQTVAENSLLDFTLNGQDIDGSPLTYSCITACPSGLTVDGTTGQVNWTPDYTAAGEYFVTFSVSDGIASANQVGKITVTQVNAPPTINAIPDQTIAEMAILSFTVSGQDIDGDTLTFSCTQNCPTGLTVDGPTGNVTWQPTYTQAGEYLAVFTVSDGSLTADTTAKITVTGSNAPPTLTAIPDQTVAENNLLTFTLDGQDIDGDTLTYSCKTNCQTGLVVDGTTGQVNWTPDYSGAGEYLVTFAVSDGSFSADAVAKITVSQVNAPPTLDPISDQATAENTLLTFTITGQDIDGDTLTYSCITACPTGLTVDGATGLVSWTPDFTQAGIYDITFQVSDGSLTADGSARIAVGQNNAPPELSPIADQTIAEQGNLSFNLNASDIDGDTLTFSCVTNCPTGLTVDGATGAVNWTPDYSAAGEYMVTFSVTDGTLQDSKVGKITVTQTNAPPTLAAILPQTTAEMNALSFAISGNDVDGDTLTYSCITNCPAGLTINSTSGLIEWTPSYTQAGVYDITFQVSDGSLFATQIGSITVAETNAPPVLDAIADKTVAEQVNLAFTLTGSDIDNDPLTFSCKANCPAGLNVDGVTGAVSWIPDYNAAGEYNVTFAMTDGLLEDTKIAKITVSQTNAPPELASISDQTVAEQSLLSFTLSGSDIDGDTLTYTCEGTCPAGLMVNGSTGVVEWTPSYVQAGEYNLTFRASDGSLFADQPAKITVTETNAPPELAAIPDQSLAEQNLLNFTLSATDIDNDTLSYSCITACPTGLVVDSSTGAVSWTPDYNAAGEFNVTFSVTDGALTDSKVAKITVTQTNAPPELAAIADQTIAEQNLLSFTLSGSDIDGDALTYTCEGTCPLGLNVNGTTGVVEWTPSYVQAGEYNLTFRVSDGSLFADRPAKITVTETNAPPELAAIPDQTVAEQNLLSFTLSATDVDNDTLTYSCSAGCPTGLNVDGASGAVTWTPDYNAAGEFSVTFAVTDGSLSDSKVAKITVTQTNAPPLLSAIPDQTTSEMSPLSFTISGSDLDGDTLSYTCQAACPTGLTINASSGLVEWTPNYTQAGEYNVTFRVSDGSLSADQVGKIIVTETNAPPELAAISDQSVMEQNLLSFTLSGSDIDGNTLSYSCSANCPTGLSVNATSGVVEWTPDYNGAGEYFVTFKVSDGSLEDTKVGKITVSQTNAPPGLAAIPDQSVAEMTLLSFNLSGSDIDGDTLTYSCSANCPTGLTVNGSTGLVDWTPDYTQAGAYTPTFQVSDGTLMATQNANINVTETNAPPELATIPDQSVAEMNALSFNLSGADIDGDSLTYSCEASCPTGLTVDASTGAVSWTPSFNDAGEYNVTFGVSDGSLNATQVGKITVTQSNAPPELAAITPKTVAETNLLSFTLVGSDIDGDTLTYSCAANCPSGLTVNGSSGLVEWTPDYTQAGPYSVTFQVSDGSLTDDAIATITVDQTNAPPDLAAITAQTIEETSALNFTITATDIDGDTLSYSCITNCPSGLVVDSSTGVVSWTPDYDSAGVYVVSFQVSDGSLQDSKAATITVTNKNQAPTITTNGPLTVDEGATLNETLVATDPDGDSLTFSCTSDCPSGLAVDGASGAVTWAPSQTSAGTYNPTFRVSDGTLSSDKVIQIVVNAVNIAPTLFNPGNQTVEEAATLTFTLSGSDPDMDPLSYSCSAACPAGLAVDGSTGQVSWTTDYDDAGIYAVQFSVSDGALTDSLSINIEVTPKNQIPVFNQPPSQVVMENDLLTLQLEATDGDGDALTYSCIANCPDGLTVNLSSGMLEWTPDYNDQGTFSGIQLSVSDGQDTATRNLTIVVNDVELDTIIASFSAVTTSPNTVNQSLVSPFVDQDITMVRSTANETINFNQITRPAVVDNATQGNDGSSETESFIQSESPGLLDLLIVIDNSSSMIEEQTNLSTKLGPLLSSISNSDWQIGVTTTDPSDPCLRGLIKKGDANFETNFQNAIQAGEGGSNNEMGIRTAVDALQCSSPTWVRSNSTLGVLVVSDEDNCNLNGFGCSADPWSSDDYLIDYLNTIRTVGTDARVYGIIWHPTTASSDCTTAAFQGNIYASAITRSGGTWGSICSSDYTSTLQAISSDIATLVKDQFQLAHVPVSGTVEVRIDGVLQTSGYTVVDNVIEFSTAPTIGSNVQITYLHDPVAKFTYVDLSEPAVESTIIVAFNGSAIDSSDYTYNSALNRVTFNTQPPDNTAIQVNYRKDIPLTQTFNIGTDTVSGTLSVEVDGSSTSDYTFNIANGDITFNTPPTDGATVSANFTRYGAATLTYAVSLPAGLIASDLEVYDINTSIDIPVSYSSTDITFDASDFAEGRQVRISYFDPTIGPDQIVLPSEPFSGTLLINNGLNYCENGDANVTLSANIIDLSTCVIDRNLTSLKVDYEYLVDHHQSFDVTAASSIPADKNKIWKVYIDDVETTAYSVSGITVTLDTLPPQLSTVKIELTYEK